MSQIRLPQQSQSRQAVLAKMRAARDHDVKWREGRVFSLVFNAGDEVSDMLKEAYDLYFAEYRLQKTRCTHHFAGAGLQPKAAARAGAAGDIARDGRGDL